MRTYIINHTINNICSLATSLVPRTDMCSISALALVLAVACPGGTTGINLPSGCTTNAGYSGTVTATTTAPYYAIDNVNGGAPKCIEGT